ncbi:hypothetical protein TUM22923_15560 [Polynucleobacter sp. TUM22923]|uniref:hypothetical protein n=1 Tax=Polynucleobacter sp. TUM22923 TaxID=3022126 RepID=UPI0025729B6A|nr:hypothetical protein [Polynucleobacter sp. TUM22923]BDX22235.1 hypothetical protein TUM22923_15560 [Polynucleobacter sp. TUM22923]
MSINAKSNEATWLKPLFKNIPEALKKQGWAVWKAEPREGKIGKFNKAPINPLTGNKVGSNQPGKFITYEQAKAAYEAGSYTGVGVLLTGNGIIGIDIDDAEELFKLRPEIKEWVDGAISEGAYCEISPSGNGYRLFVYGKLPVDCRKKQGGLEIYDDVRFLTVTGNVISAKKVAQ